MQAEGEETFVKTYVSDLQVQCRLCTKIINLEFCLERDGQYVWTWPRCCGMYMERINDGHRLPLRSLQNRNPER